LIQAPGGPDSIDLPRHDLGRFVRIYRFGVFAVLYAITVQSGLDRLHGTPRHIPPRRARIPAAKHQGCKQGNDADDKEQLYQRETMTFTGDFHGKMIGETVDLPKPKIIDAFRTDFVVELQGVSPLCSVS
jgi:hypothetical protein